MPAQPHVQTGSITAVGQEVRVNVTESSAVVVVAGGTGSMSFIGEVSYDGGTTWVGVLGVRLSAITTPVSTISMPPGTVMAWPTLGADAFRARCTTVTTAGTTTIRAIPTRDPITEGMTSFTPTALVAGSTTIGGLSHTGATPLLSINAGAALANGTVRDALGCSSNWSLTALASAGVTAGVVTLETSMDNVNWVAQGTITLTAPGIQALHVTDKPYRYGRARISTAVVGGTVTCHVASAG